MTARLSADALSQRAKGLGFELVSAYNGYQSNETVLDWRCLKNREHVVATTLGHLVRGCPRCRRESRESERRFEEFDAVARNVIERGDVLLSGPGDYVNQSSVVRYVCSLCGDEASQTAQKAKRGQRHGCQQMAAAQGKRRQEAYDAVVAELSRGGVELLTPVEEYGGLRSTVKYRLADEADSKGEATVLRLQRLARSRTG